jgi:hypothetical protein
MALDDPQRTVHRLIAQANTAGGADNITSVVVSVKGAGTDTHPEVEVDLPVELPLFSHFTRPELADLGRACEQLRYPDKSNVAVADGQDALLIVIEGALRLLDDGGGERGRIAEGQLLSRTTLRVATEGATRLLVVRWSRLSELLALRPRLAQKLLWSALQALARPPAG